MKSQIDFVLCPLACSFGSFVLYDLVASDHRPIVCHIYDVITAPVRSRNRNVKGWRPRSLDAVADVKAKLRNIPSDSSADFLENPLFNFLRTFLIRPRRSALALSVLRNLQMWPKPASISPRHRPRRTRPAGVRLCINVNVNG